MVKYLVRKNGIYKNSIEFFSKRVLVKDAITGKLTNRVPNRVIVVLFNHTDDRLV